MTRGLVSAPSSMASMMQSFPQEPGRLAVPPPVAPERPATRAEAADGGGPGALRQQGPLRVSAGSGQQQTRRLEYSHTDLDCFFFFESWVFTHIINLLKVLLLERGSCQSSKAAWIFTNNLPNCSGRISYPVAVPDAPRGMYWRDALFNEPFEIFEGSIMAGTKPLVLVLEPTHATS